MNFVKVVKARRPIADQDVDVKDIFPGLGGVGQNLLGGLERSIVMIAKAGEVEDKIKILLDF